MNNTDEELVPHFEEDQIQYARSITPSIFSLSIDSRSLNSSQASRVR